MPDRELAALSPHEGMFINYVRDGVNTWVIMIEKIEYDYVNWIWVDGISTLEEANRVVTWPGEERYKIHEWHEFMINPSNKWGNTSIVVLTHTHKEPEWEV